jgi:hypothetical protein
MGVYSYYIKIYLKKKLKGKIQKEKTKNLQKVKHQNKIDY